MGPMYAQTMLTKFNSQSSTCVKNAIVFYYIHDTSYSNTCHVCIWHYFAIFVMKCVLKLPYLNYLKSLTIQFSTFLRNLLARRNLCTPGFRASGLAVKWCYFHYDEAQHAVFWFICVLWYSYSYAYCYILNTLHDLI